MLEKIKWLGHSSVRIDAEKIIYIDPWKIQGGPKADLILVSHTHGDHLSPADVKKIQKTDTVIVAAHDAAAQLSGDVRALKPGGRIAYITCSVLASENNAQVQGFVARHPEFAPVPPAEVAAALWDKAEAFLAAALVSPEGLLMTPRRTGTDGFFVCVLKKAG